MDKTHDSDPEPDSPPDPDNRPDFSGSLGFPVF
jgi:hypothetical protein